MASLLKRWRLQWSLRTLFVVVMLVAIIIAAGSATWHWMQVPKTDPMIWINDLREADF
jgi:hypothetical protein